MKYSIKLIVLAFVFVMLFGQSITNASGVKR